MKIALEYVVNEDGKHWLNYWDWNHGNDVVCREIDGTLFLDDDTDNMPQVTLLQFLNMIAEREGGNNAEFSQPTK